MIPREKKFYQLIISRLDGDKVGSQLYREKIFSLVRKGIGGFIVFGGKRHELRKFISALQASSEIPLFIASDIERGVGQQIAGTTVFPCQMAVAASVHKNRSADVIRLREALKAITQEARLRQAFPRPR
jgi:beta-glucosidase-like glycosyl hydrolase